MENIYKQYATIASSWVPNNPILAFLPFIKKYIIENKIREIRTETLMKNLKATYDLDFSLQLVISSMTYLQKNKQVEKKNGCWVIKFENEKIELSNTSIESKTNFLLAEFKKYCSENKINEINCEASLNNFFESYDHEIMVEGFENVKNDKLEKENKVVAHFLVYLQKNNEALFNFAVEIAKGSLVKSALFLDNRTFNFLNENLKNIKDIEENGVRSFLIVKSEYSLCLGFKEMEQLQDLIERGAIVVWCLDEHGLLVNPEKAK